MPIFEFVCESCDHQFETLTSHREQVSCPSCESTHLEKLMSASAGHVASGSSLPMADGCPPPEAGPCSPHCCRLPQG